MCFSYTYTHYIGFCLYAKWLYGTQKYHHTIIRFFEYFDFKKMKLCWQINFVSFCRVPRCIHALSVLTCSVFSGAFLGISPLADLACFVFIVQYLYIYYIVIHTPRISCTRNCFVTRGFECSSSRTVPSEMVYKWNICILISRYARIECQNIISERIYIYGCVYVCVCCMYIHTRERAR